jgi:hypothetical protein
MKCCSLLLIVGLLLNSFGQAPNDTSLDFNSVRLDKNKPSIYITFERRGKRQPLYEGEVDEGVWLRLHNNTRWTVYLCTFGVENSYGDVGLFYSVERRSPQYRMADSRIPLGYQPGHVCHMVNLEPGTSLLFSVPADHVAPGLKIRITFNFSWERYGNVLAGNEPQHSVSFNAPD